MAFMKIRALAGFCVIGGLLSPVAFGLDGEPSGNETVEQRDARMAWWREAKFGMFIHWGIYAVPAGNIRGQQIGGMASGSCSDANIPVADYRGFCAEIQSGEIQSRRLGRIAKDAGMRYMVITSKHHDGFALFPSEASDWNVADATPWQRI